MRATLEPLRWLDTGLDAALSLLQVSTVEQTCACGPRGGGYAEQVAFLLGEFQRSQTSLASLGEARGIHIDASGRGQDTHLEQTIAVAERQLLRAHEGTLRGVVVKLGHVERGRIGDEHARRVQRVFRNEWQGFLDQLSDAPKQRRHRWPGV